MYKCIKCNKEFEKQQSLASHCIIHSTKQKIYKCKKCGKEFTKCTSYRGHCSSHNRTEHYKIGRKKQNHKIERDRKEKIKQTIFFCKHCNKEFDSGRKKGAHSIWCKENISREETRLKVSKLSSGRKHSEYSKELISKKRIEYLMKNPDKVPYLLNHSSKESYPEKVFRNALENSDIKEWIPRFQHSIYQYDFAFPKLKIDVEIDGGTHLTEKVKKIDERRDKFSKENGWKVIRFTAKEVKENVVSCINKLKKLL